MKAFGIAAESSIQDYKINTSLDLTKITNIEFEGIDHRDSPKYCDAFISSAQIGSRMLTDEEIDTLNDNEDFKYEKLNRFLN